MAESKESKHVVMFPFMAQGHFIPFLSLAKMLASHGLNVSFLTTTANASKLQSQAVGSSIRFVSLSLPPIHGLPPACESTDVLTPIQAQLLFISSRGFHHVKDPVGDHVNSCDFLPEGFIEETRDRGMVIHGWVPQLLILSHPSTAFFMTHCGWNSTLESISAGVPMVLWPMAFEQFINAKLVIEQLGLGLQICEGLDVIPSSDIVENTVKAAMATEMGEDMRQQALKIKESINEASCKLSGIKGFVSYILSLGSR